jgi:hypothetical protein
MTEDSAYTLGKDSNRRWPGITIIMMTRLLRLAVSHRVDCHGLLAQDMWQRIRGRVVTVAISPIHPRKCRARIRSSGARGRRSPQTNTSTGHKAWNRINRAQQRIQHH